MTTLADNLRRLLRETGKTPKALSRAIGRNATYVRDILAGRSQNPRPETVAAMATALGVPTAELTGDSGELAAKIDPGRLRLALLAAAGAFRGHNPPDRETLEADLAALLYDELCERARLGTPITTYADALRLVDDLGRQRVIEHLRAARR